MHLPATAWGVGWYIAGDCKKFGKHCCRVFVSILVDNNVKILLCYSITAYNGAHLSLFLSHSCTWGSNPDREAWLKNIMWPIKLILHTNTHVYIYTHTHTVQQNTKSLSTANLCWMVEQLIKVWHKQVCLWTENSLNYTFFSGLEPFSRLIKRVSFADIHWEDKKPCFFFVKFGESGREFVKHNNDDYDNDCI